MKNDGYLLGKYRGKSHRVKVQCYRKTQSVQIEFRTACGSVIPITQNLGSAMPLYRCVLADGLIGPGNEDFMEYIEKNSLGYIFDYKWYDYDASGRPRRVAAVFQFDPKRLRELDPMGCKQYVKHRAKLMRRYFAAREVCRKAG